MNTIDEYLSKTESAARKIFEGIDSYFEILSEAHSPVYISSTVDDDVRNKEYEDWELENRDGIVSALKAQNKFADESFSMSSLCGALLQLAAMGIQKYSSNTAPFKGFEKVIREGSKPAKYCIGRLERDIPIGLIIYAGRNQFNHFDEDGLREPNLLVFEKLCQIESFSNKGTFYRDPAFDLTNDLVANYASNITSLLGWRSYEIYHKDLKAMIGEHAI